MDPRCPIFRATEGAGLGQREGPTDWDPLPSAGPVGRKEEGRNRSRSFLPPETPLFTLSNPGLILFTWITGNTPSS